MHMNKSKGKSVMRHCTRAARGANLGFGTNMVHGNSRSPRPPACALVRKVVLPRETAEYQSPCPVSIPT